MASNKSKNSSSLLEFIEETKMGKYTNGEFSIQELIECTITREEIAYLSNNELEANVTVLYGIN